MIAWAGMEMYEAGYRSSLSVGVRRKWAMDGDGDWVEGEGREGGVENQGVVDTRKGGD